MRFFKIVIPLILSATLQSLALNAEAETPPSYYTNTTIYTHPDNYCLSQGEWSGDLSQATLKYLLTVSPTDQTKYGDIFVGFRQRSAPDKLWLFGFSVTPTGSTTKASWIPYDQKQVPVVYSMGQLLPATTNMHILDKPTDITQFQGDGEVLVGYGLRKNERSTSPTDSFKDMLDHNRFISVWQVNNQQPTKFGHWICFKFTEMTEKIEGLEPTK